jgi:hypothetical protein
MRERGEGPEPDGDSAVQLLAAALKRYRSLRLPAAGGEGRANVRIHAQGLGRRAGPSAVSKQMRQAGGVPKCTD